MKKNSAYHQPDYMQYLKGNFINSMYFTDVKESDIVNIVSKLQLKKSRGYDGFNTKLIKSR